MVWERIYIRKEKSEKPHGNETDFLILSGCFFLRGTKPRALVGKETLVAFSGFEGELRKGENEGGAAFAEQLLAEGDEGGGDERWRGGNRCRRGRPGVSLFVASRGSFTYVTHLSTLPSVFYNTTTKVQIIARFAQGSQLSRVGGREGHPS